ncbi:hypothetical protein O6P43_023297 [Quillaja saponaria]|uniref:Uncharacterized protein n=1 Tax=Quillaja saponaria TaxID=32244 RepID=A0AAD7LGG4_QUISA|nr:hypothetical protein O6P43_023297 [Quillaja saponaria]
MKLLGIKSIDEKSKIHSSCEDEGFWKLVQKVGEGMQEEHEFVILKFQSVKFQSGDKGCKVAAYGYSKMEMRVQCLKWIDGMVSAHVGAKAMMVGVYALCREAICRNLSNSSTDLLREVVLIHTYF